MTGEPVAPALSILDHALASAARGWRVLPLKPRDKVAWLKDWPRRASADPDTIRSWFEREPACNYGVLCGTESGIVVLDVDPRNGGATPDGLPETYTVRTGGGGFHYYFRCPDPAPASTTVSPGVEVKSTGRYVAGSGSIHPSGDTYAVALDGPLAPFPTLDARRYGTGALRSECERVASASEGSRNETLVRAAFRMGQLVAGGALAEDMAEAELVAAATRSGLSLREARSTARSGLRSGQRSPRGKPLTPAARQFVVSDGLKFADDVLREVAATECDIYQRSFRLVRVVSGPESNRGGILRPAGQHVIAEYDVDSLTHRLAQCGAWVRITKTGETKPAFPPASLVKNLLARDAWPFPVIEGIVETPTLRPDGSVLSRPGYDPASGVVFCGPDDWPAIPETPTAVQVRGSIAELYAPLQDFPFREDSDRSAALSAILTTVARPAIEGPVPLYAIRAPSPGTGKTLLADVVALIATGRVAPRLAPTREDEETRKRVAAIAIEGASIALLDNVDGSLGSPSLAAALTATEIRERVLGESRMVTIPHRAVWLATGNNLAFRGDVARRVVPIDLDAHVESPELRGGFQFPDLTAYVLSRRRELVTAALTILRWFHVEGRPDHANPVKGSFEAWDALVRGAVIACSLPDPDAGSERIRHESDPERQALEAFLSAVFEKWMEREWTGAEICKFAEENAEFRAIVLEFIGSDKVDSRRLSYALRKYKGRIASGKLITSSGSSHGLNRWRISG